MSASICSASPNASCSVIPLHPFHPVVFSSARCISLVSSKIENATLGLPGDAARQDDLGQQTRDGQCGRETLEFVWWQCLRNGQHALPVQQWHTPLPASSLPEPLLCS